MSRFNFIRGLLLGAALVVGGCDGGKKEPAKTPAPVPPPAPVQPQASAPTTQPGSLASAKIAATTLPTTHAAEAANKINEVVAEIRPAKSAEQSREAQDLIAKAIASIKDNKFDDARKSLDQAESMKESLPQITLDSLKKVRTDLDRVEKLQNPAPPITADAENK